MKNKRSDSSIYSILYWLVQDSKIDYEIFFTFSEFFWPSLIEKSDFIFLKERFSEEGLKRLLKEKANPEYWINLITVEEFYPEILPDKKSPADLLELMATILRAKLQISFPEKDFLVAVLVDEETSEYGLTFYQNYDKLEVPRSAGEMPKPSIKQNRIENSPQGPRPGIPMVRKPEKDEFPHST